MELKGVTLDIDSKDAREDKQKATNNVRDNVEQNVKSAIAQNGDTKSTTTYENRKDGESDGIAKNPWAVRIQTILNRIHQNRSQIYLATKVTLSVGFFVYFGFAVAYHVGDEGSWRLIVCTIFGVCLITWRLFQRSKHHKHWTTVTTAVSKAYQGGKRSLILRW